MAEAPGPPIDICDVWRTRYSDLYKILKGSDSSRNDITIELYSKRVITESDRDKIMRSGTHDAELSTSKLLDAISAYLKGHNNPAAIAVIITVLRKEDNLMHITNQLEKDMEAFVAATTQVSLQHPLNDTVELSPLSTEAVSPQSLVSVQFPESPQTTAISSQSVVTSQSLLLRHSVCSTTLDGQKGNACINFKFLS